MSARRFYRRKISGGRFTSFTVTVKQTDLWLAVSSDAYSGDFPVRVEKVVWNRRSLLEAYIARHPGFETALKPYLLDADAPSIVSAMAAAANRVNVGPMAAVAGAIAEAVGHELMRDAEEVIVENGGDIFLKLVEPIHMGIYAGPSPLSGKLALRIEPGNTPLAVCTSSGTVGPSLSLGRADAALVMSASAPLADAAATALGNLVREPADLETAMAFARKIEGITGALVIIGEAVAAWGEVELVD